ncbi:hypothetical protein FAM09_29010 [Niastella caeni]|uniref:Lipocalin-like domain-containing protein n=1 Tax=Niastella caeni TaxID=2569763 RepID=A0A4V4GZ33_9BACT|nr:hypothetical protein [Niastella caeni]THU31126.1 hypothetical protein FAM09_29010 [Niastella caeni]
MKKLQTITICVSLIMMVACEREDSLQPNTNKALLLGKWQLEKTIDEFYQPVNVLKAHEETPGEPGDSVVFKNDNQVYSYQTVATGVDEEVYDYEWVTDSIIKVDGERYTIRKLTTTTLVLYKEETDNNGRDVEIGIFMR